MKKCIFLLALLALAIKPVSAQNLTTIQDLFPFGDLATSEKAFFTAVPNQGATFVDYYQLGSSRLAYRLYLPSNGSPLRKIVQYWENGKIKNKITFSNSHNGIYLPSEAEEYRKDGSLKYQRVFSPSGQSFVTYYDKKCIKTVMPNTEKGRYADYKTYSEDVIYYHLNMELLDRIDNGMDIKKDDFIDIAAHNHGIIDHMLSEVLDPDNDGDQTKILERAKELLETSYKQQDILGNDSSETFLYEQAMQKISAIQTNVTDELDISNRVARYAFDLPEFIADKRKSTIASQALTKITDEISETGKLSDETLSMLVQNGSVDFLSNYCTSEYKEFMHFIKDVLNIDASKGLYNLDYYKDARFEEVVKDIKELKAVIKK